MDFREFVKYIDSEINLFLIIFAWKCIIFFSSFFRCKNCGATDHRHWECQEQKNITSQITCNKCGGYGHVAADCQVKTLVYKFLLGKIHTIHF